MSELKQVEPLLEIGKGYRFQLATVIDGRVHFGEHYFDRRRLLALRGWMNQVLDDESAQDEKAIGSERAAGERKP